MKVVAALLAGHGIYEMCAQVLVRLVCDDLIERVYVYTPPGRVSPLFENKMNPKITVIENWIGEDSHNATAVNREALRQIVKEHSPDADWYWFGDDDALPCPGYFEELDAWHFPEPVLITGKTYNLDGRRWYDICSFQTDGYPFTVPYDDWQNPRWAKDLYASGNQHVLNRAGFLLDVPYPDIHGEDPHFCWAFRKAGGQVIFRPELSMQLLKWHQPANPGYKPCLPK